MKVVLYGATGRAGSRILSELLSRGHAVRAVVREPGALEARTGLEVSVDDLSDVSRTAEVIRGCDAVISAYAPPPNNVNGLVAAAELLVEAVNRAEFRAFSWWAARGVLRRLPELL